MEIAESTSSTSLPLDQSVPDVGCLSCTSKKRSAIYQEHYKRLKAEKKAIKEEKDRKKKEDQERKKLEKEKADPKEKKKKNKRKHSEIEKETLPEVTPVMVTPNTPKYEFDQNKFRIYGKCPECSKNVSSYIKLKDVPEYVLDELQVCREELEKKPKEKKTSKRAKKGSEKEESAASEKSEGIL
jgi:hypothetical protein